MRLGRKRKYFGLGIELLDPYAMNYRSENAIKGAQDCAGCIFRDQPLSVCNAASERAQRAGFPDCDDLDSRTKRTFIYVLVPVDPRQAVID